LVRARLLVSVIEYTWESTDDEAVGPVAVACLQAAAASGEQKSEGASCVLR
jgi:hypothetical protein